MHPRKLQNPGIGIPALRTGSLGEGVGSRALKELPARTARAQTTPLLRGSQPGADTNGTKQKRVLSTQAMQGTKRASALRARLASSQGPYARGSRDEKSKQQRGSAGRCPRAGGNWLRPHPLCLPTHPAHITQNGGMEQWGTKSVPLATAAPHEVLPASNELAGGGGEQQGKSKTTLAPSKATASM